MNEDLVLADMRAGDKESRRALVVGREVEPGVGLPLSIGAGPAQPIHLNPVQVAQLFEHLRDVMTREAEREKKIKKEKA